MVPSLGDSEPLGGRLRSLAGFLQGECPGDSRETRWHLPGPLICHSEPRCRSPEDRGPAWPAPWPAPWPAGFPPATSRTLGMCAGEP